MDIQALIRALHSAPWAVMPGKLAELVTLVSHYTKGTLSAEQVGARIGRPAAPPETRGKIAILAVQGVLLPRDTWGGAGTNTLQRAFRSLVESPDIEAIMLDVDSPGGVTWGTVEFADEIAAARGRKPIVAVANSLAASAAYWIASQADAVIATPSGDVGSIGVWSAHVDVSKMLDEMGVKISLVSAGKFKTEGNPYEPLSEEAQAYMQHNVDQAYEQFVSAVARGRKIATSDVKARYGEGRVLSASDALQAGMIDGISTLDQVVGRLNQQITAVAAGRGRAAESIEPVVKASVGAEAASAGPCDEVLRFRNEVARRTR